MPDAPQYTDTSDLEANYAQCLECGSDQEDPEATECWNFCEGGGLEYFFVSLRPLGYDDDDQFVIRGRAGQPDRWQYIAHPPRDQA